MEHQWWQLTVLSLFKSNTLINLSLFVLTTKPDAQTWTELTRLLSNKCCKKFFNVCASKIKNNHSFEQKTKNNTPFKDRFFFLNIYIFLLQFQPNKQNLMTFSTKQKPLYVIKTVLPDWRRTYHWFSLRKAKKIEEKLCIWDVLLCAKQYLFVASIGT